MQALIPLHQQTIGAETIQTVDARDLHTFLGISRDYATWVRTWLKRAHLIQDRDYIVFHGDVENSKRRGENAVGGRPATDYYLTFDAAKCIGMMSGSAKGDEIRQYFLDCEKAASAKPALPEFHNPSTKALVETLVRVDMLEQQVAQLRESTQRADTKAETAMYGQAWMTIHQYVLVHKLETKFPESQHTTYAKYLTTYCLENGYRIYPQPVAYQRWKDEQAYYVQAIHDTLPQWLLRRHAQITLMPQDGGSLTHDPATPYQRRQRRRG